MQNKKRSGRKKRKKSPREQPHQTNETTTFYQLRQHPSHQKRGNSLTSSFFTFILLAAGIVIGSMIEVSPWFLWWGLSTAVVFCLVKYRSGGRLPVARVGILIVITGMLLVSLSQQQQQRAEMFSSEQVMALSGRAAGFLQRREDKVVFSFAPTEPGMGKIMVHAPLGKDLLLPGDGLLVTGRVEQPKRATNPGEYDYAQYLARQGIFHVMYLEDPAKIEIIKTGNVSIKRWASKLQYRWIKFFQETLPEDACGLLVSLVLGNRAYLRGPIQQQFQDAGVAHLLSVSGFHVGIVSLFLLLLAKIFRLKKTSKTVFLLAGLWLFVFTAGLKAPVIRAAVMWTIAWGAEVVGKDKDGGAVLWTAGLLMLGFAPRLLFEPGFQLSFAAVAGIVYLYPVLGSAWSKKGKKAGQILAVSMAVQWSLFPLLAFHFHRVSWLAPVSQVLLVPLAGVSMLLGMASFWLSLCFYSLGAAISVVNAYVLDGLIFLAGHLASIPFCAWNIQAPGGLWMMIWYGLLFLFVWGGPKDGLKQACWRRNIGFMSALCLILFLAFSAVPLPLGEVARITFLDVGQGDAAFVQTKSGQNLLIDGGNRVESENIQYDMGQKVVAPFLKSRGVNRLDMMMSHAHDDHIGGLGEIGLRFYVGRFFGPKLRSDTENYHRLVNILAQKEIPDETLTAGDILHLDSRIYLEVLNPPLNAHKNTRSDLNNNSLVLRLQAGPHRILFTGDIEEEGIVWLMGSEKELASSILKVPHHGSRSSYHEGFYQAVGARAAVISVGGNFFGHPGEEVVSYFDDQEIILLRTDQQGAITVRLKKDKMIVTPFLGGSQYVIDAF